MACRERHSRQGVARAGIPSGGTAGSAWSGSSPAVCDLAHHGRIGTGGKQPQARVGRHGRQRRSRDGPDRRSMAGMGRMAHQLLAWQAWSGPSLLGMASLGRRRKGWLPFDGRHGRQRSMGKDYTVPNGSAGKASHAGARRQWHGRQRNEWHGWPITAGLAGIAGSLVARQAVQRSARQPTARQARHGTLGTDGRHGVSSRADSRQARCGLFGRQATAGPASMASQCVEGAAGTAR